MVYNVKIAGSGCLEIVGTARVNATFFCIVLSYICRMRFLVARTKVDGGKAEYDVS